MKSQAVLVVVAIAAASCGSTPGPTVSGAMPTPGSTSATRSPSGSQATVTSKPPASAASPSPARSRALPSGRPVELSAVLAKRCVGPGETQTLTVRTQARAGVIFDTIYSDGMSGGSFGGNYGGNAGGFSDSEGGFERSWVLAPNTPPGEAKVHVVASKNEAWGERFTSFRVRPAGGTC